LSHFLAKIVILTIFENCGNNEASVTTFVAKLFLMLDNVVLLYNYFKLNDFSGNEYWNGHLSASGDPAAACCTQIPELQNAYINQVKTTLVQGQG